MQLKEVPIASMSAVKAGDRAGWLALFTEDALVQDPVGPSDWDPEGAGLKGKAAIGGFYDAFSRYLESFDFEVHHLATGNSEIAVFATMHSTLRDGSKFSTKAISVYDIADDGRIRSLRSYQK